MSFRTTATTDCGFIEQVCPSKAYRIVHTYPCVYCKCIYTYAQSFGWTHRDSCQISLFLIQECIQGQPVQKISHTVCTTIYILYINTQKARQLVIDSFRDKLIWRKTKSSSDVLPSRDTKHVNVSTTLRLKGFSRIYRERKWYGQLRISSVKKDKDCSVTQQLSTFFFFLLQDHCAHHSTAFLSGTEIKDPVNEMSSAINKIHCQGLN